MPIPKKIQRLMAKFNELFNRYDAAMQKEGYETARKFGADLCDFFDRYGRDLNFTDEQISEMKRLRLNAEISWEAHKIAEAKMEKAKAKAEKAKEKYHQTLLEQSPQGKSRTEH